MSSVDLTDFGMILPRAHDPAVDVGRVCPRRNGEVDVVAIAILDVPHLELALRLLHVHELPEDGLTFRALL